MIKNICFDIEPRGTTNPSVIASIRKDEENKECPGKPTSARPRKETVEKYEQAVEEWNGSLEQRIQDRIDATAKDPLLAEPVCISAVFDGEVATLHCLRGHSEQSMLERFFQFIAENCEDESIFTGYCIKIFDLPVLITRSRILDIRLPSMFPKNKGRYWSRNVVDIQDLIFSNKPYISFCEAATAYGIEAKKIEWLDKPMTGKRVQEAIRANEYDLILKYCEADASNEYNLYKKCVPDNGNDPTWMDLVTEIIESDLTDAQKVVTIRNLV
jgi:DNA polymerase elongation subunit (family B)